MTKKSSKIYKLSLIAMFSALMCIGAPFCIYIGSIPITLSLFFVFLTALFLPPAQAFLSMLIYVLLGAVGLPVFSGFLGSVSVIMSFTGGFILAYPIVALLVSFISRRSENKAFLLLAFAAGLAFLYTVGSMWYMMVSDTNLKAALITSVLPFIPFDILKAIASAVIYFAIKKRIK